MYGMDFVGDKSGTIQSDITNLHKNYPFLVHYTPVKKKSK